MKILVTGLGGFTGAHLKQELEANGHTVIGLASNLLGAPALNAEIQYLCPDAVIHLAGIAFVGHADPNAFYQVNLLGSRNLLAALSGCNPLPKCVLLASSANIYGNAKVEIITEDTPADPTNDYAVSKLAMEHMALLWLDRLPIVIARPFNYTGVGQEEAFLFPKIVNHFRRRDASIELGNLDVSRDIWDVRLVVECYRRLIECPAAIGRTFNVCSGRVVSLLQVLDIMKSISGHDIDVRVNPAYVRQNEVSSLLGSGDRLEAVIGRKNDIAIEQTLRWMLESDT
jgi:nucleoside-diphosphate-sugar epimerase